MLRLGTRPDRRGVWIFIEAPERLEYAGQCIAIGAGGRRTSIAFRGTTSNGGTWRLIETPFPVLHGALTDFELRLPSLLLGSEPIPPAPGRPLFPSTFSSPFTERIESQYPEQYPESQYPEGETPPEPSPRKPRKSRKKPAKSKTKGGDKGSKSGQGAGRREKR
jgi:hypothetical protein